MLRVSLKKKFKDFSLDISLEISDLSYNFLLGPSGSGKSLTLKIIAGFEIPDKGKILLNGKDISMLPPEKRKIVYLPQNLGIFPHLSVREQLLYPFSCQKKQVDEEFLDKIVKEFRLETLLDRMPNELSQGEKQRVVLARSILARPKILLIDEPLTGLDFHLRMRVLDFLEYAQKKFHLTVVHVTHDPIEALRLAEHLFIIESGRIKFKGTLKKLFHEEINGFASEIKRQLIHLNGLLGQTNRSRSRGSVD